MKLFKKILPFIGVFVMVAIGSITYSATQSLELTGISMAMAGGVGVPATGTVTTEMMQALSGDIGSDIILSDTEYQVTVLRRDIAPLDTMLRVMGSKPTNSYSVKWGESGLGDGYVTVATAVSQNTQGSNIIIPLTPATFDYAVVSAVYIYLDVAMNKSVVLFVIAKDPNNQTITCRVIGGAGDGSQIGSSGIAANYELFFNGVAKNELDAQTEPFQRMPEIYENYCQIQMCQVEQGLYNAKQKKEIDWGLLEFKSDALFNFRHGCEMTALKGIMNKTKDVNGKDVYLAGGLEGYVGYQARYVPNATVDNGGIGLDMFHEMGEKVFTNIAGSDERAFFCSPQLMTNMLKNVEFSKMMSEARTEMRLGIKFKIIETGFGEFAVKIHKGLGMTRPGEGVVVDVNRIRQRVFDPMGWRDIELLESGQSKADAQTLEEYASYEFRAKKSHLWVYTTNDPGQRGIIEL